MFHSLLFFHLPEMQAHCHKWTRDKVTRTRQGWLCRNRQGLAPWQLVHLQMLHHSCTAHLIFNCPSVFVNSKFSLSSDGSIWLQLPEYCVPEHPGFASFFLRKMLPSPDVCPTWRSLNGCLQHLLIPWWSSADCALILLSDHILHLCSSWHCTKYTPCIILLNSFKISSR